ATAAAPSAFPPARSRPRGSGPRTPIFQHGSSSVLLLSDPGTLSVSVPVPSPLRTSVCGSAGRSKQMILILSQSALEPTTEEVMDWLEALGGRCVRLNGDDLEGRAAVRLALEDGTLALGFSADGLELPLRDIGAVWFRRWMLDRRHEMAAVLD